MQGQGYMARKAFFTRDEIFAAADTLLSEGEDVTARALRAYLGGGSFSSIMKGLSDWKAERIVPGQPKIVIPPVVANVFDNAWKAAIAHAAEELAAERKEVARQVDDAEMRLLETVSAIEDLENTNSELQENLTEATKKLVDVESKVFTLSNERAALTAVHNEVKEQLSQSQRNLQNLQFSSEQVQRLHTEELNKLKMEVVKLETSLDSTKEEAIKSLERFIHATEESKEAALKYEARLEAASQERDQAIKVASELTGRLEAIEQHNKELLAKLQQSENSQ
jgi:DNA repair exonuclease SbcCD ATPase subunit